MDARKSPRLGGKNVSTESPNRGKAPTLGKQGAQAGAVKSTCLGMPPHELIDVLERLDATSGAKSARRQTRRMSYRHWPVPVILFPPHGNKSAIAAVSRNISRGGVSFLHTAYVHTDLPVVVVLKKQNGQDVQIAGRVSRCRHIERHLHEVGVRFNSPIDVHEFLPLDHVGAQFSLEVTDPGMLRGRLLLVADYDIDRTLILHMLEGTKLEVVPVRSMAEGLQAVNKTPFDVVLSDYDLGVGTGIDLLKGMRQGGSSAPLIIMSSDVSGTTRTIVRDAKCDAFLNKPFTKDLLLSALAEYLLLGSAKSADSGVMTSTLPPDSPLLGLVEKFTKETHEIVPMLEQLLKDDKPEEFVRLATRLAGTATALGFAPLSRIAESAIRSVNATSSLKESSDAASTLVAACKRVEGKAAA